MLILPIRLYFNLFYCNPPKRVRRPSAVLLRELTGHTQDTWDRGARVADHGSSLLTHLYSPLMSKLPHRHRVPKTMPMNVDLSYSFQNVVAFKSA